MRFLVLGCGRQGRAVLHDLLAADGVARIVAADAAPDAVAAWLGEQAGRVELVVLDAGDRAAVARLMDGVDVVVDMLPRQFLRSVGELAVAGGVHLVNTMYSTELNDLAGPAAAAGVALLPELGFDPGIDLVLYGEMIRRFERLDSLHSYGGGIPEPAAADNPLRYKISWTWEGVLFSYDRRGRKIVDGEVVDVEPRHIFDAPEIVHVDGVGDLESFDNGDMVRYAEELGLLGQLVDAGRHTLRWPGHCELWRALVELGFLEQSPVPGLELTPRQFMVRHLEPRLQYADDERDLVVLRVLAEGLSDGRRRRVTVDLVDRRDLTTGLMAMNRTVGFPAAIAARMLADGRIADRGLLSPARHVPCQPFLDELARHGIVTRERDEWL